MFNKKFFVHETTIIDQPSVIGSDTKIWHWCHISKGVNIGKNCIFGQNVFIGEDVKIGNNVKVQNNVSIFKGVEISDDVFCGPSMVFTNVLIPRAFIEKKNEFSKTYVGKGASLGANVVIICGNKIGNYSMIGAGSVITKSTSNFSLVMGNPGKHVGWVSRNGNRLKMPLFNKDKKPIIEKCTITNKTYKLIKNKLSEE